MQVGSYKLIPGKPPVPQEDDFRITEALAYMQRGLSASYDFTDFIYVVDERVSDPNPKRSARKEEKLVSDSQQFKKDLSKVYLQTNKNLFYAKNSNLKNLEQNELIISSFDTRLWNQISNSSVKEYNPPWQVSQNDLDSNFPDRKKNFYKFNIVAFFQIKKCKKDQRKNGKRIINDTTTRLMDVLSKHKLKYYAIQGQSKVVCGVPNAIIGGRFNDGQQKPKDPYTFYLHCLIGYEQPQHLGGSYLIAQKCVFDWLSIHNNNQSLTGTIGRNTINDGSFIFSQHHCPRSHIKLSRIKDNNGNPVTLHRQSKSFVTDNFQPTQARGLTDNINPEEGLFFIGYNKDPQILEKMYLHQLGNNSSSAFQDGLLNHFKVDHGNILYTPNIFQITGLSLKRADIDPEVGSLCEYHQTRWLKHYKRNEEDEEMWKITGNHYYNYSRAGFLKKMSYAHQYDKDLDPPSPRILRLLSRTFSLWQDTWYFDRKQPEMDNLIKIISYHPAFLDQLQRQVGKVTCKVSCKVSQNNFRLKQWKQSRNQTITEYKSTYRQIPMVIRNGLAVYYNLAHLTSTQQYGCRGNQENNPDRGFGANTFHIQPQDVLVGGEANLTFGQGKHVIEYLIEQEMMDNWVVGQNLSGHSGIGHVIPHYEEILNIGLDGLIAQFKIKANQYAKDTSDKGQQKYNMFMASVFSLLGIKQYFINYSQLAQLQLRKLHKNQTATRKSLQKIKNTMLHLSTKPPIRPKDGDPPEVWNTALHQGAQLILSIFICLHLTGQPISVGRLDYCLRDYVPKPTPKSKILEPSQEQQDIIDSFFLKVGEKANFNKGFFEDHQKWGNLAMGGNSGPYPQSASFNQWGMETVIGGSNKDNSPFYNVLTVACLRASRTVPVNAPCLGLRLHPKTPQFIIEEATKTVLSGGAHPFLMNDQKIIAGLRKGGDYVIKKSEWDSEVIQVDGKKVDVPYQNWNPKIAEDDLRNFASDGCHQFLPQGKTWFWLSVVFALEPLQYILNVGMDLLSSGNQYIHGRRMTYRCRELNTYKSFQDLEKEYQQIFFEVIRKSFEGSLLGFENLPKYCPATLLNAFTADMKERESDFYLNGANYRIFCPQITGVANFINAMWNIKTLVFEQKVTTLEQIRQVLLVNWGDQLEQPFVPKTLPPILKERLKLKCDMLRTQVWRTPKFGVDKEVTQYGLRFTQRLSRLIRKVFQEPSSRLLKHFKTLTYKYGSKKAPFGFQYMPGCGTFENFYDFGQGLGASFDGRKKAQSVAEDYAPQNFLYDKTIGDRQFEWKQHNFQDILRNYSYSPLGPNDPELFSGAVLDTNINQDYNQATLAKNITQFAEGVGSNCITISVGSHNLLTEAALNTDRDLLRFRMGGWSQFAVAMFPHLLEHHIRRLREIAKPDEEKMDVEDQNELQKFGRGRKRHKGE